MTIKQYLTITVYLDETAILISSLITCPAMRWWHDVETAS